MPPLPPAELVLDRVRLAGDDRLVRVAVDEGRVVAVGTEADLAGADEVVDAEGRVVLPGLWDHHVHAVQWASARARVDVRGAGSAADAAEAVRRHLAAVGPGRGVLVGHGMRHLAWPDVPDRTMLDAAIAAALGEDAADEVAVVVQGVDLHTAWASSEALRQAGLAEHRTGLLREADCFRVVATLVDAGPAEQDRWVRDALHAAAARGVTGIRDFEFGDPLLDWQRRTAAAPLPVRVAATVYPEALEAAIERGWPTGHVVEGTDGMLQVGHAKAFVDGALNSRTALCHHPYPGSDDHGSLELAPEALEDLVRRGAAHGIEPAIHAIGDRAVAVALDVLDAVGCAGRVEHAQLVAEEDLARFAAPGRVAGVQPAHLLDDRGPAEELWPGRTDRAFPLASLGRAGARLELGSDAPVSPLDPWRGIAAAVTRTGDDQPPWHPEQAITVHEALAATSGGAVRPAVGGPADLVVVDLDPLRCDPADLWDPGVWATMVAGRWTHRA